MARKSFKSFEDCRRTFQRAGHSRKKAGQECAFIFSKGQFGTKPKRSKK